MVSWMSRRKASFQIPAVTFPEHVTTQLPGATRIAPGHFLATLVAPPGPRVARVNASEASHPKRCLGDCGPALPVPLITPFYTDPLPSAIFLAGLRLLPVYTVVHPTLTRECDPHSSEEELASDF